mgnify:CR=1 FL=1
MKRVSLLWKDKSSNLGIKFLVALMLLTGGYLLFANHRLPPEIPLFYFRPWGEEQLAAPYFLWVLLAGVLLISFLNSVVACFLFEEFPLLARILVWASVLVSFITSMTVFKVFSLIS